MTAEPNCFTSAPGLPLVLPPGADDPARDPGVPLALGKGLMTVSQLADRIGEPPWACVRVIRFLGTERGTATRPDCSPAAARS